MANLVKCPQCEDLIQDVPDEYLGKRITCKKCDHTFRAKRVNWLDCLGFLGDAASQTGKALILFAIVLPILLIIIFWIILNMVFLW